MKTRVQFYLYMENAGIPIQYSGPYSSFEFAVQELGKIQRESNYPKDFIVVKVTEEHVRKT